MLFTTSWIIYNIYNIAELEPTQSLPLSAYLIYKSSQQNLWNSMCFQTFNSKTHCAEIAINPETKTQKTISKE